MGYKKDKLIESDESGSNILYSAYEPKDDDKDHNWEKNTKEPEKR